MTATRFFFFRVPEIIYLGERSAVMGQGAEDSPPAEWPTAEGASQDDSVIEDSRIHCYLHSTIATRVRGDYRKGELGGKEWKRDGGAFTTFGFFIFFLFF